MAVGEVEALKGQTRGPAAPPSRAFDPHPLFAAMKCPANSHYELCADTCSLSCSALSATPQCPDHCAEGCQCDPGFLNDGQACVPIQKCGCYHDGIYYEVEPLPLPISPTACPLGLLTAPTHPSPTPYSPAGTQFVPSQPSRLLSLFTIPWAAGKTFVNMTMAPATLNPPLTPQVKGLVSQVEILCLLGQQLTPCFPLSFPQLILSLSFECLYLKSVSLKALQTL